jgi:hypothetical protein
MRASTSGTLYMSFRFSFCCAPWDIWALAPWHWTGDLRNYSRSTPTLADESFNSANGKITYRYHHLISDRLRALSLGPHQGGTLVNLRPTPFPPRSFRAAVTRTWLSQRPDGGGVGRDLRGVGGDLRERERRKSSHCESLLLARRERGTHRVWRGARSAGDLPAGWGSAPFGNSGNSCSPV